MLEDILEASGVDSPDTAEPDYFLGPILLLDIKGGEMPTGENALPPRPFDIVDGQQRIATATLIASVLRDLEEDAQSETARSLERLIATPGREGQVAQGYRLTLRPPLDAFFHGYVQRPGACSEMPEEDDLHEPVKLLFDVREHLLQELSSLEPGARAALARYLAESCHVVVMLTRDIDRAHRMFVVLNGRGKPLGRQDILKAEMLRDVPEPARRRAEEDWDSVAARLGVENLENFFSHLRVIHGHGSKPVISGVRDTIASAGGAGAFLSEVFEPLSRAYDQVLRMPRTQAPFADEIRALLVYMSRLNGVEWVPAAMQAIVQHAERPQRIAEILRELDRFAHLQRILCRGSAKRIRAFAGVIEAIKAGRDLAGRESPTNLSTDDLRLLAFNLRDLHGRNQQVCKLVLLRVNDILAGQLTEVDIGRYTIEHIVPQRPKGRGGWARGFPDPQERDECIRSLGNLTLIAPWQNEKAKNKDFPRKKAVYAEAAAEEILRVTHEVIAEPDWRAGIVRDRERRFLGMLDGLWRIGLALKPIEREAIDPTDNPVRRKRARSRRQEE